MPTTDRPSKHILEQQILCKNLLYPCSLARTVEKWSCGSVEFSMIDKTGQDTEAKSIVHR